MSKHKPVPDNQITFYQTPDGKVNVEVLYADENVWLSQKRMAELFDVDRSVVTKHLRNVFASKELEESSVCAKFAHTAEDGKEYETKFYSLEAVIARPIQNLFDVEKEIAPGGSMKLKATTPPLRGTPPKEGNRTARCLSASATTIPLLRRGGRRSLTGWFFLRQRSLTGWS